VVSAADILGARILVVDDMEANILLLEGMLRVAGYTAVKLRALEAGAKDFVGKPFDMAELRARVHNILEVRLLHQKTRSYSAALEATVRELEASREVIRLQDIAERKKREEELVLAQQTQESLLPHSLPEFENYGIHAFSNPTRYVGGDFYDFLATGPGQLDGRSGGRLG
jgi:serine phosphatase RsbU (regulator of sigma subunit)